MKKDIFTRQIIGGAYAVMDSYGTGSEMDDDNPFLSQYINLLCGILQE